MSTLVDISNLSFPELQQLWVQSRQTPDAVAEYTAALAPKPKAAPAIITADTSDESLNGYAKKLAHDMGLASGGRLFCFFVLDLQRQIDALKRQLTPPHMAKVEKRGAAERA